jgi:hypothetical protein
MKGDKAHRCRIIAVTVCQEALEHNRMNVFLSYSYRDDALASRLTRTLESEGIRVWYGSRDILPGDNWAEKIAKALADSDAMVVLISPSALESSSVKREIEYALGKTDYNRHRLIPVVVGGRELLQASDFPWILKKLNIIQLPEDEQSEEGFKRVVEALRQVA